MDANLKELLEQGFAKLEENNWDEGESLFENVLSEDPECGLAHAGKLLASLKVNKLEELKALDTPFDNNNNFKRAVKYADDELKATLEGYNNAIYERLHGPEMEKTYREATMLMEIGAYTEAIEKFEQVKIYKNSVRLAVNCKKAIEAEKKDNTYRDACALLDYAYRQEDIEAAVQKFVSIISWKDSKAKIDECGKKTALLKNLSEAEIAQLKEKCQVERNRLAALKVEEENEKAFKIANLFVPEPVFDTAFAEEAEEEVAEPLEICEVTEEIQAAEETCEENIQRIEETTQEASEEGEEEVVETVEEAVEETIETPVEPINESDEEYVPAEAETEVEQADNIVSEPQEPVYTNNSYTAPTPKKKSKGKVLVILLAVGLIGIILLLVGLIVGVLEYNYQKAVGLADEGYYEEAKQAFSTFSFYRDSEDMINECDYKEALEYLAEDNYEQARAIFRALGDYSDSKNMVNECSYQEATDLLSMYYYQDAKSIYESLGEYKDSSDMVLECDYQRAVDLWEDGNLDNAESIFRSLGYYKDSYQMVESIVDAKQYEQAVDHYRSGEYAAARNIFNTLSDYEDTEKYLRLINAHTSYLSNASSIYDLVGFEDADDIILEDDDFLQAFLMGNWKNYSGNYMNFTKKSDGSTNCNYNISAANGAYFKIENGCYYVRSEYSYDWRIQWRFTLKDEDTIDVYSYNNSTTYTLYRQ